jgi:DNA-binding MarR family transcriptional regulator
MEKEQVKSYAWLLRGKQRTAVFLVLDRPKTPKQVSEQTELKFSNVSDVLRSMVHEGIAVCLNPEDKTGRLYELTVKGKRLRKEML